MSLATDMFNPKGRLRASGFQTAALILIAIGAIFSILPVVNPALATLGIVSLVLIYPWVVIWVKRLHDAGKSGWLFLAVLVVWLIVSFAASAWISAQFGPPPDPNAPTDLETIMATMGETARATAVPSTIASVVISVVFVVGLNAILKGDVGPNAYGPPPP